MELSRWSAILDRIGSFALLTLVVVLYGSSFALLALIIGAFGFAFFALLFSLGDVGKLSRWHPDLFRIYFYLALIIAISYIIIEPSYLAIPVIAILIFLAMQQNWKNTFTMALLGGVSASLISDLYIIIYCQGSCSYYSWPTLMIIKAFSLLGFILGGFIGGYRYLQSKKHT